MRSLLLVLLAASTCWGAALPDSLCIRGTSMEPALQDGRCYALRDTSGLSVGDVVWLPGLGRDGLVKRLAAVDGDTVDGHIIPRGRVWITADAHGLDSKRIGAIPRLLIRAVVVLPDTTRTMRARAERAARLTDSQLARPPASIYARRTP